jgi:hypothetical protein
MKVEENRSKSKETGTVQATTSKKEVAIKPKVEQLKLFGRDKSKDTTKKTSDKPSKVSKQLQSKAETSLGLVVDKDMN